MVPGGRELVMGVRVAGTAPAVMMLVNCAMYEGAGGGSA